MNLEIFIVLKNISDNNIPGLAQLEIISTNISLEYTIGAFMFSQKPELYHSDNNPELSQTFKKRKGTSAILGHSYETKLLMLFLLRGLTKTDDFYLAANMQEAGDFDDIVFKYRYRDQYGNEKLKIIFLQAKHRENLNNKITYNEITNKYFNSYSEIKRQFSEEQRNPIFRGEFEDLDCDFIIYTNAPQPNISITFKRVAIEAEEKIFNFTKHYFKPDESIDFSKKEFFENLKFFSDQPNESKLSKIIVNEIQNIYGVTLLNAKLIFLDVQEKIQKWSVESVRYLRKSDEFFENAKRNINQLSLIHLTLEYRNKVQEFGVNFKEDAIQELQLNDFLTSQKFNKQVFNIVTKQNTLTAIKIHQILQVTPEYQEYYIFMQLESVLRLQNHVMQAFKGNNNLLIIECKPTESNIEDLYKDLKDIISEPNKKIILITQKNDSLANRLKHDFAINSKYQEIIDKKMT
ncbi:hypothetical protein [Wolbachia pipientis]|uniref:hypothetical protein n=1 Tax=Wolbachia pipientis TaxID=955 RepID=UPI0020B8C93A|nr:hypothetical protein [Wolbachia pipientis]